ncbi:MAG: YiiD C-terminal domain-containing protein [Xanthomonadaceae bacterium]|nr:YiiD C-terminal domain-containing protein [Xanthomonadaceae bacterium]
MSAAPSPQARLQHKLDAMPPVRAMAATVARCDAECLQLVAPLAANVNDKGCAFGGSLSGLMTLAAWGALTLRLEAAGIDADVYVANCQVAFRAPVYEDIVAEAVLAPGQDWEAILARLRTRGRARAHMSARILMAQAQVGAEMEAQFALIAVVAPHA